MTVHVFIHLNAKRAKTTSLLDSGMTENFLNLNYAKWLCLPIRKMSHPQKLFDVDGMENKAGQLQYYTDLAIHTRSTFTNMCFFLTELGEHKAILGLQQYNQKLTGRGDGLIKHNYPLFLKHLMQQKHNSYHKPSTNHALFTMNKSSYAEQ